MFGIYHRMQAHPSGRASPRVERASPRVDKRIMSETTCFDPVLIHTLRAEPVPEWKEAVPEWKEPVLGCMNGLFLN